MIHRRSFITGLVSALAAPAIVHAGNLMPIKTVKVLTVEDWLKIMNEMVYDYHKKVYDAICASSETTSFGTLMTFYPNLNVQPVWAKDFYK